MAKKKSGYTAMDDATPQRVKKSIGGLKGGAAVGSKKGGKKAAAKKSVKRAAKRR
jgi:hypothetical protein